MHFLYNSYLHTVIPTPSFCGFWPLPSLHPSTFLGNVHLYACIPTCIIYKAAYKAIHMCGPELLVQLHYVTLAKCYLMFKSLLS